MGTFEDIGNTTKAAEQEYNQTVPKNSYLLLRLDGKAFHTYTKGFNRPFDTAIMKAMDAAMMRLLNDFSGARIGYTQSDEITILLTDWKYNSINEVQYEEQYLGGKVQKLVSISASLATATFNHTIEKELKKHGRKVPSHFALFDSRVFSFDATKEGRDNALNAFKWRHIDAVKNSVNMLAHDAYGHKKLMGINTDQKKELLKSDDNVSSWEEVNNGFRFGRFAVRENVTENVSYVRNDTGETHTTIVERSPFVCHDAIPELFFTKINDKTPQAFKSGLTFCM